VTVEALKRQVGAGEREVGLAVIKGRWIPRIRAMTFGTIE